MSYNTVQRKAVIDFLSQNNSKQFTINEIVEAFENIEKAPGKSTIYRIITRLVSDGIVKRFVQGHSRHFSYQIAGCGSHCSHIHLKCTLCGKLIHLNNDITDKIHNLLSEGTDFVINNDQTVIYGICMSCRGLSLY